MIPEQVGVADVGLQNVHRLVTADVAHLEDAGAAAGGRGQETGPQRMGAEGRGSSPIRPAYALMIVQTLLGVRRDS